MKRSLIATVTFLVLAASAWAQMPGPFSADVHVSSPRRDVSASGKMYFSGTKMRMEMTGVSGERARPGMGPHQSIIINDMAQKVTYMLMPERHMYMEIHPEQFAGRGPRAPEWKPYDPSNPCANETNVTCKKVGTETVNGRSCDRWEFTGKDREQDATVWIDQKTHIPIKRQGANGSIFELTNIVEGTQPANLFEVPPGYQKFDMGQMMRGMPRRPRSDDGNGE